MAAPSPDELFKKWDANSDGKVTLDEMVKATGGKEEKVKEYFTKIDKNSDGAIDLEELRAFISFNGFSAQSARFKRRILRALNHQWDHDRRLSRLSQPFANPFEPKLFSLHRPGRSRRRPSWKWASRRSALLTPRPQSGRPVGCPIPNTAPG